MNTDQKLNALISANVSGVANMTDQEIHDAHSRLVMQGAIQAAQSTAPQQTTQAPQQPTAHVNNDLDALAAVMFNEGQNAFKKAIQATIEANLQQQQQQHTNAIERVKKEAQQNTKAQQVDNIITRTIRVNKDGETIEPPTQVNFVEYKKACDLWPELPQTADYEFPVCDYDPNSIDFYDTRAVHNSGVLHTLALTQKVSDKKNHLWLNGDTGTGKSTLVENMAKKCGRPFTLITCDATTDPRELVGGYTIPDGKSVYTDGALLRAIRTPYSVICIDEISKAPLLFNWLQGILSSLQLTIAETGEVVPFAEGVTVIATDNTSGHGDTTGRFDDTLTVNQALKERFSFDETIDYMDSDTEQNALQKATNCTTAIAAACVDIAYRIRNDSDIEQPISFRRLQALATALNYGISIPRALESAIYKHVRNDSDVESYRALFSTYFPNSLSNI